MESLGTLLGVSAIAVSDVASRWTRRFVVGVVGLVALVANALLLGTVRLLLLLDDLANRLGKLTSWLR